MIMQIINYRAEEKGRLQGLRPALGVVPCMARHKQHRVATCEREQKKEEGFETKSNMFETVPVCCSCVLRSARVARLLEGRPACPTVTEVGQSRELSAWLKPTPAATEARPICLVSACMCICRSE